MKNTNGLVGGCCSGPFKMTDIKALVRGYCSGAYTMTDIKVLVLGIVVDYLALALNLNVRMFDLKHVKFEKLNHEIYNSKSKIKKISIFYSFSAK